jgi:para-aminobenzoate synthetase component 1
MLRTTLPNSLQCPAPRAFAAFEELLIRRIGDRNEWVIGCGREDRDHGTGHIGHFAYHFPDAIDASNDLREAEDGFEPFAWWRPRFLLHVQGKEVRLFCAPEREAEGCALIERMTAEEPGPVMEAIPSWSRMTSRADYLEQFRRLQEHIQRGDSYEVNYCTARTAYAPHFDPFAALGRLVARTDAPFATLYRRSDRFAVCASPERYLRMEAPDRGSPKRTVLLQPMKGTRRRVDDPEVDERAAHELANDPKERSENIMAVDVARNDLSRIATSGSVRVPELCAVKSHGRVHQLVSTVSGNVPIESSIQDVLRATFPMASMTGAPKRRAMELIAEAETMARGLFSGALGFELPDGTVDLNVVIRTITWDKRTGVARLITGSAITAQSDAQREWEECELKAQSVLKALADA